VYAVREGPDVRHDGIVSQPSSGGGLLSPSEAQDMQQIPVQQQGGAVPAQEAYILREGPEVTHAVSQPSSGGGPLSPGRAQGVQRIPVQQQQVFSGERRLSNSSEAPSFAPPGWNPNEEHVEAEDTNNSWAGYQLSGYSAGPLAGGDVGTREVAVQTDPVPDKIVYVDRYIERPADIPPGSGKARPGSSPHGVSWSPFPQNPEAGPTLPPTPNQPKIGSPVNGSPNPTGGPSYANGRPISTAGPTSMGSAAGNGEPNSTGGSGEMGGADSPWAASAPPGQGPGGDKVGLGLLLDRNRENITRIGKIAPGLAAGLSKKIQVGDILEKIDDEMVNAVSLDEVKRRCVGEEDSVCVLRLVRRREFYEPLRFDVSLTRTKMVLDYPSRSAAPSSASSPPIVRLVVY